MRLKISESTISFLAKTITGDNKLSFYRSGPELVHFFNEVGFNDVYGRSFPSRWVYAEDKIRELNDSKELYKVFELLLDPRKYIEHPGMLENIVTSLNECLKYDGYEIVKKGILYKVRDLKSGIVETSSKLEKLSHEFIDEQIEKCEEKLVNGDYDGAITNSRSLVEAVLIEIEKKLNNNPQKYDGDLPKLYGRVKKQLNLEPERKDIDECLKQILGGLNSIVVGLAGLRNKMSDSHVRTYKPYKHHALLAINSAKTFVNFVLGTYEYQKDKSLL